jgi:hypothetical protein
MEHISREGKRRTRPCKDSGRSEGLTRCVVQQTARPCLSCSTSLQLDFVDLYLMHWPHGFNYEGPDVLFPRNADMTIRYSDTVGPGDPMHAAHALTHSLLPRMLREVSQHGSTLML